MAGDIFKHGSKNNLDIGGFGSLYDDTPTLPIVIVGGSIQKGRDVNKTASTVEVGLKELFSNIKIHRKQPIDETNVRQHKSKKKHLEKHLQQKIQKAAKKHKKKLRRVRLDDVDDKIGSGCPCVEEFDGSSASETSSTEHTSKSSSEAESLSSTSSDDDSPIKHTTSSRSSSKSSSQTSSSKSSSSEDEEDETMDIQNDVNQSNDDKPDDFSILADLDMKPASPTHGGSDKRRRSSRRSHKGHSKSSKRSQEKFVKSYEYIDSSPSERSLEEIFNIRDIREDIKTAMQIEGGRSSKYEIVSALVHPSISLSDSRHNSHPDDNIKEDLEFVQKYYTGIFNH